MSIYEYIFLLHQPIYVLINHSIHLQVHFLIHSSVLGSTTVAMLRVLLLCVSLMAGCCAAQTGVSPITSSAFYSLLLFATFFSFHARAREFSILPSVKQLGIDMVYILYYGFGCCKVYFLNCSFHLFMNI